MDLVWAKQTAGYRRFCWLRRLGPPGRRRGAAAVEFAVVAPVLLILVFGMIDVGRMIMVQQLMNDAAREGARTASLGGSSFAEVSSRVSAFLDATSVDASRVQIEVLPINLAAAERGDLVTVRLSVAFADVSWLPTPRALGNRTLLSHCTMRHE